MMQIIKKVILSTLLIAGISVTVWILLLLNPSLSYAHKTKFDYVTVYHNQELDEKAELVVNNAINIIKNSELFDENITIELCMNDDLIYPEINPFVIGEPSAYASLNKTVIKNGKISFAENTIQRKNLRYKARIEKFDPNRLLEPDSLLMGGQGAFAGSNKTGAKNTNPNSNGNTAEGKSIRNNPEFIKYNLTHLLAHEFTHNLQFNADANYVSKSTIGKINWKLEGYADYIAREFKNDGALKSKIDKYIIDKEKGQDALLIIEKRDGTKKIHSYFKYALMVQYLIEVKELNFKQICELDTDIDEIYSEMIEWRNS